MDEPNGHSAAVRFATLRHAADKPHERLIAHDSDMHACMHRAMDAALGAR
jgi:hypothetical protein